MHRAILSLVFVVGCGGGVSDGSKASSAPPVPPPSPSSPPVSSPAAPPPPAGVAIDDAIAHGRSLAADDTQVFVASEERSLARFPALLDAAGTPLSTGFFGAVTLDTTSIYAVRDGRGVVRVPKAGGPETVLATLDAGATTGEVRVAAGIAYFLSITSSGQEQQMVHCTLARVSTDGGATTPLLTYDRCGDLVADAHAVYAMRSAELLAVPADGSAPSVLLTLAGADTPGVALAHDDTRVWVATLSGSRIFSVTKADGTVEQRLTTPGRPHSITVAGDDLYWLEIPNDAGGTARADLMTAPKSGGPARKLLADVEGAEAIAVNSDAVYCAGLGALHRVPRH